MTTRLEAFRDWCQRMATAGHKPECPSLPVNQPWWSPWAEITDESGQITGLAWCGPPPPTPTCEGCNSEADRALFARLGAEVDDYVNGNLFSEESA